MPETPKKVNFPPLQVLQEGQNTQSFPIITHNSSLTKNKRVFILKLANIHSYTIIPTLLLTIHYQLGKTCAMNCTPL